MKLAVSRLLSLAVIASLASTTFAGQLGFEEDFALAPDRTVPLKQLIPGTADYYYYNILQAENTGDLAKADQLITDWIRTEGGNDTNPRIREMQNRQALLNYDKNNQASLDFIARRLNLTFDHQRQTLDQQRALPTALDPTRISRATLTANAMANYNDTLEGFEPSALNWIDANTLSPRRLHEFLSRLERPDVAGLVNLVNKDLSSTYGSSFSLPIHHQMLLAQLEELARIRPAILNDTQFIDTYLMRLRPANGVDWRHDPKEQQAYLDRLWTFAARLGPLHNSLKAHILYQRLVFDRTQNVWDKDRFLAYIQLPKSTVYMRYEYMNGVEGNRVRRDLAADLNRDFSNVTAYRPIGSDEQLVRSYLLHFFVDAVDDTAYGEYIDHSYLAGAFAEAKIVNGIGDQEKWFAMATNLAALRDRIDIDFAYTNKQYYNPDDAVSLDLNIKNVKTLIVKVYDINLESYYKNNMRELGTDMPLDGLVANDQTVYTYDDAPLPRVARHFDFPKLTGRGAYMIEFIGNGISSRALVIKGKLHYLEETGNAGHVFSILDEKNQAIADASLWLAGHEYKTDQKSGVINVPFSTAPGPQPIILQAGEFASFDQFTHDAENYSFKAAFHVDREELIRGGTASVIIRPMLYVNGEPVSLHILDDDKVVKPTLVITSVDREGTPTSKEIPNFPLLLDRETTYDFVVPDNLVSVTFALKAQARNLSQNKTVDLVDGRSFSVNGIDATDKIEDIFLSRLPAAANAAGGAAAGYVLDVRGKTGEALADRPISLSLKHKDFRQPVQLTLRSDDKGRIVLGNLEEIASFTASTAEGVSHTWSPEKDQHSPVASAHGAVGAAVELPYMGGKDAVSASELSLLELRDGQYYADRLSAVHLKEGLLTLDDLPAGDYSLRYKETGENVAIRIAPGVVRDGWVLAGSRFLEQRDPKPLQIAAVGSDATQVTIKLTNATKLTRVHVVATRYVPEFPLYASLASVPMPGNAGMSLPILDAQYVAGRNIGDEYRYILDRKYAEIFPGNSLTRPGLILNPWSIRKTETGKQIAAAGQAPIGAPGMGATGSLADQGGGGGILGAAGAFSSVDFLPSMSVVIPNLVPNEKGEVLILRKDLGDHQDIQVVAVDLGVTVGRHFTLPEVQLVPRDLRLKASLDLAKHFTEQKQITLLQKGGAYSADDAASSSLEAYDSVARVYKLYATISNDPTLAEFAFITEWPKLTAAQKREKYSKYACHELNFFLSRKDPEFFNAVIVPYLKNKKDKTFMDHYLLKEDLSVYLKPSEFDRLNMAERTLLGERLADQQANIARHEKDRYDLLPPDADRFNFLFRTALQGGALDQNALAQDARGLEANSENGASRYLPGGALAVGGTMGGGGFGGGGRGGRGGAAAAAAPASPANGPATQPADYLQREVRNLNDEITKQEVDSLKDRAQLSKVGSGMLDLSERDRVQQLYLKVDKTEEWAENNYYHVLIENQNAGLIPVSAFWRDYAAAPVKTGFLTVNLAEAGRNFSEMMLALGVLDLPFESPKLDVAHKDGKLTFTAPGPMVVYHRDTSEATLDPAKTPILVSQNFFRASDRYTYVDNEKSDKYVSDEFLTHVVYGCQVVVTNPTSSRQRLDVLLQVPEGAIPVANGLYTRGVHTDVEPFQSRAVEYYFYFPSAGVFTHYPVHVARNEKVIAFTAAAPFKVVDTPSKVDTGSWDYISQNGTPEQVLQYLRDNNIDRLNLDRIAWRMRDGAFFTQVTDLLGSRHVYNGTLWSYGLKNNNVPAIREYLQKTDGFANACGPYIDSKLLTLDPVARRTYQFLEYMPLINARAHKMGLQRQIVNDREFEQYERLLTMESYRPTQDADDLMAITYYLLLQDRIDEARNFFGKVDASKLSTQLQYDYFRTYLDFYTENHTVARGIINKYVDYPVDRWRQLFVAAGHQLDEIDGKGPATNPANPDDRNLQQGQLAANAPNFDFAVENRKVTLNYQNIASVQVNYYLMDIELMFSQNPFLGRFTGQFSSIRPNDAAAVKLDPAKKTQVFDLPERFANSNVMIEITADGITRTQTYYPNSLNVQMIENYGQVQVTSQRDGKPLPKTYIKVYARLRNGQIEFYKDGYTDLRGRFEYASLSTNDLDNVDRFSVLILSDAQGAVVREAAPPKQ